MVNNMREIMMIITIVMLMTILIGIEILISLKFKNGVSRSDWPVIVIGSLSSRACNWYQIC